MSLAAPENNGDKSQNAVFSFNVGTRGKATRKETEDLKRFWFHIVKNFAARRNRAYKFKSLDPLKLCELARQTLNQVTEDVDPRAVVYLASVIEGLSTGPVHKISTAPASLAENNAAGVADDPLASARARGRRFALEQYEDPDNLGLLEARDYAGRNERTINELRQKGELYALLPPGKTRGFRYPKWQFDVGPERLRAALSPFVATNANCWVIHSFMLRKRESLGGKSPADVLRDDSLDIKAVVALAESDMLGEQGAQ
ncbi:hypothetical protein [Burkholderia sp. MBR-1]|uniref:hypothetical protein n=1 Tax=Burkholderia sp. MBR-1 TaxID=2732364 RepID=UPI0015EFA1E1|nr:hypothetical protein [Burkholderia sp. MBR-1]QMI49898.1 hypothetical protein MBR110_31045 [Burkholderia sp. MBR-1]